MSDPIAHTGRGGAGNVGAKSPPPAEETFHTPTIKQTTYTTGRGGTGNMAKNENQDNARLAQDVSVPAAVAKESSGPHHIGRGGGGNFVADADKNGERAKSKERSGSKERTGGGVIDKAKEMLKGKK